MMITRGAVSMILLGAGAMTGGCGDDARPGGAIDGAVIDGTTTDAAEIDAPTDAATDAPTDAAADAAIAQPESPTAFRMSDLDLRDPHVYFNFLGCRDVTDTPLAGFAVNDRLQTRIQTDGDNPPDGVLDLSIATVFRPLAPATPAVVMEVHYPSCTAPIATTICRQLPASPVVATMATSQVAGTCLSPIAGTTHGYTPTITSPTGPCYVSAPARLSIDLGGIPVTLRDAQVAATYVGSPADNTVNGLLRGFLAEVDANNTMIPATLPLVGGQPLSTLFPGGDPPGPNNTNCAPFSDLDINNGVRGWWFYLNFTAPRVTWIDN